MNKVINMEQIKEVKNILGLDTKEAIKQMKYYNMIIKNILKEDEETFRKSIDMLYDM